jgi:hypothetical protein
MAAKVATEVIRRKQAAVDLPGDDEKRAGYLPES